MRIILPILVFIVVLVDSKLWVYAPENLRKQFVGHSIYFVVYFVDHGEIKSSYANYGIVPYGSSMVYIHYIYIYIYIDRSILF